MRHDNPMMIGFVKNEMTLKTTLLLCDRIITVIALVSCITGPKKSYDHHLIATSVAFSTNIKLCSNTNSFLMKHIDALESKSAWVHTIMDLPPLIMMGNKKQIADSERQGKTILNT
jgi:hypothetical protein